MIRHPGKKDIKRWAEAAEQFANATKPHHECRLKLSIEWGRKYVKLINHNLRIWAYIDLKTGDVLKPADWSSPSPFPRGNIFETSPSQCCDWDGPKALRKGGRLKSDFN